MNKGRFRMAYALLLAGFALVARAEPVTFSFHAPAAGEVHVTGSFDAYWQKRYPMKKDASGRWILTLDLPPGRYEFLFLIDGQWRHDPSLPAVADAFGGWNNVLVVMPGDER